MKIGALCLLALTVYLSGCQMLGPITESSPELTTVNQADSEESAWQAGKASRDVAVIEAFLTRFPDGKYASSAALRLKLLKKGAIK